MTCTSCACHTWDILICTENGEMKSNESTKEPRFKTITLPEMKTFAAIILCMSLVTFPALADYWKNQSTDYGTLWDISLI
jgi:hypothetical protein